MQSLRLLRFLTLFAVLFAALSMSGGHGVMAMPAGAQMEHMQGAAMSTGHCADMEQKKKAPEGRAIDCMIACTGLPTVEASVDVKPFVAALRPPLPPHGPIAGVLLEMEPPPPRLL